MTDTRDPIPGELWSVADDAYMWPWGGDPAETDYETVQAPRIAFVRAVEGTKITVFLNDGLRIVTRCALCRRL
jgi:hypothetical protein